MRDLTQPPSRPFARSYDDICTDAAREPNKPKPVNSYKKRRDMARLGKYIQFNFFFDKHIGLGIRWELWGSQLELSISLIFFTIRCLFGK